MGEYIPASISFPEWALQIPEAKKALIDSFDDPKSWEENWDMDHIDGVISLRDPEARDGEFADVEKAFRKNNIPFDRWNGAYAEFNSEELLFRPELDNDVILDGNVGDVMIPASRLESILDSPNLKEELQKLLPPKVKDLKEYKEPVNTKKKNQLRTVSR